MNREPKKRPKWPGWKVLRPLMYELAQYRYQQRNATTMEEDFEGITATKAELREAGFFWEAKCQVLRAFYLLGRVPSVDEIVTAEMMAEFQARQEIEEAT